MTKIEFRVRQLKIMHKLMCTAYDENIYYRWVTIGVPDSPTEEDFKNIAEDEEDYKLCVRQFKRLVNDDDLYC